MSDKLRRCDDFGTKLRRTIPTGNIARDALAELIGSTVAQYSGTDYEFEDLTLTFTGHGAGKHSITELVKALGVSEMSAVRNVTFPEDETPEAYDQGTTENVTVTFH